MTDAAVSLKLPNFWASQPRAWFIQSEAQFALRGITEDSTKYAYVVAALDQRTAERLLDILEDPPAKSKYQKLKDRLLSTFSLTQRQRASRLLGMSGLGDRRPTEMMDEMLALLGDHKPCFLFEELFRQQLPAEVRMSLEYADFSDPRATAQLADRMLENRPQLSVASVQPPEAVEAAVRPDNAMRKGGRAARPSRNDDPCCYFHRKFGIRARRCSPPCSFRDQAQLCSPQGNEPAGRR